MVTDTIELCALLYIAFYIFQNTGGKTLMSSHSLEDEQKRMKVSASHPLKITYGFIPLSGKSI
jgi:hypothetical protein